MVRSHCMLDTITLSEYVILMVLLMYEWLHNGASMLKLYILYFFRTGGEISSNNRIAVMFSYVLRPQSTGVKGNEYAKNQNSVILPSILTTYVLVIEGSKEVNTTF